MKKARRSLLPLLILALTLALSISALAAGNEVASGECGDQGDNVTWTLTEDGTLTISGEGKMNDWMYIDRAPWNGQNIKTVVIQNGVTSIGSDAFLECYDLTSITIPSTVTSIGREAFRNCEALKSVTIPEGVTSIGETAFVFCNSLTSVTIPSSVKEIVGGPFAQCSRLTSIQVASGSSNFASVNGVLFNKAKTEIVQYPSGKTGSSYSIPNSVTVIRNYAFLENPNLTSVTIPNGVTSIGMSAFNGCSKLSSITIPGSVKEIVGFTFSGCAKLAKVTIQDGVTRIADGMFADCTSLTSITIPSSVTGIGDWAFGGCANLTGATIPASVTSIGSDTFTGCSDALVISGAKGSYAETYAKGKGITFKAISDTSKYALPAPTGVKAENAATGIKVTWTKVSGAAKYRVFYKPADGSWTKAGDTTATSYTWTKAKSGTTYQIRVRCITSDGKTGESDFSASKTIQYVAAPNYTVSQLSTGGIKLSWSKVAGAAKYRVYYKTTGSWKTLTNTTATSVTISKPKNGAAYTFRVRCTDGSGNVTSSYIADKKLTYKAPSAYSLAAPTGVKVSNDKTGIKVSWTKVSGAAKYRVFYKPEGGSWTKAGDTTAASYTWTKAKSGTTYQIRVRCITSDGKTGTSDFSAAKSIKYIAAPKDVKVSSTSTGIKISWTKSAGAAKYRIYYKTGSGGWKTLVNTKSTSYTWTGPKDGVKYTFRVRCVNSAATAVTSGYTADKTITYKK